MVCTTVCRTAFSEPEKKKGWAVVYAIYLNNYHGIDSHSAFLPVLLDVSVILAICFFFMCVAFTRVRWGLLHQRAAAPDRYMDHGEAPA